MLSKRRSVGIGTFIHPTVTMPDAYEIGDNCYIGEGVKFLVPYVKIGDYTKIHQYTLVPGQHEVFIGHNCWIGGNCILDGYGFLNIGNNVGIGADSQIWTHIRFGDWLAGCRFQSVKETYIEDDVWFVGHCLVSPITAKTRSMAMLGSLIVADMEANHVYAGSPAKDMTEKFGTQFYTTMNPVEIQRNFDKLVGQFIREHPFSDIQLEPSYFDPLTRQYTKTGSKAEIAFMKFLLPLVKFLPRNG